MAAALVLMSLSGIKFSSAFLSFEKTTCTLRLTLGHLCSCPLSFMVQRTTLSQIGTIGGRFGRVGEPSMVKRPDTAAPI
jgi:hypothetical protein